MLAILGMATLLAPTKPNIVLILVDDLGWRDVGYAGSDLYKTPNIDRLSDQGVRFTRAYSAHPVCSPTRAAILTGKNPVRVGITDWIPGDRPKDELMDTPEINNQLALSEVTLAENLKKEGYRTWSIGKWHLGGDGFRPTDQGFDVNIGGSHVGQPGSYFAPFGRNVNPMPDDVKEGEFLTDRLTSEAIKLMHQPSEKPFFLYFPQYSVHTPIQAKPEDIEKFTNLKTDTQKQKNAKYAALIWNLDQNIGRLVKDLEDSGMMSNTIFIFTSDNGGLSGVTNNEPLRAGKGNQYEGGIRVPAFAYWPGKIKPGKTIDEPIISMDITSTILNAAGSKTKAMDGSSLLPALTGGKFKQKRPLVWHYPHYHSAGNQPSSAMLDGNIKTVHYYEDGRTEFYDLALDPFEKRDLGPLNPGKANVLWRKLKSILDSMGAKYPILRKPKT
jgi:arylsulfatase A